MRTIRGRLLLSANLTFGVFLVVLLIVNARREYANAVAHQAASLKDEAAAIHEAVGHLLAAHGADAVQQYVDDLSRGMQGSHAADHSIIVELDGQFVGPSPVSRGDAQRLVRAFRTAEQAGANQFSLQDRAFTAGSVGAPPLAVHVFEETTGIRRGIRRDAVVQLLVLAGLGVIAAAAMNLVLLKRIAAPLRQLSATVKRIADGEFGLAASRFQGAEFQQLADAVTSMSRSLAEDERRRTALMREAHAVQQHLLPRAVDIPGLQTATLFLPAEGVAGDYYDFLPLGDGTWVICIADVMGHGVPAAMGAAIFKTLLTTAVEQHVRPAEVLDFINRRFSQALPTGYFASAFVGRWLPDGRLLEYSSAGHVPGLLWGASGTTRTLPSTGLFVGLDERAVWETERCSIGCREQLLLFTDGVTEALSPSHELFGMERLVSCLDPRRDCPPDETVQVIRQAVAEHHGGRPWSDDCTLLVLEGSCTDAACGCRARAGGAGLLSA